MIRIVKFGEDVEGYDMPVERFIIALPASRPLQSSRDESRLPIVHPALNR